MKIDAARCRRLLLRLGSVLALALLTPGAWAADAGLSGDAVHFQADHDYPPFSLSGPSGGATGHDVELFRDVATRAGLEADVRLDDWQAIQDRLRRGAIDVVPMLVTPERERRFLFTQPFLVRHHLVFGRRGGAFVRSLDALRGKRIAVQRAGRAWEAIRTIPGVRAVIVDKEGDALRVVADGRADAALLPAFVGLAARRRFHLDEIVPLSAPLLESPYAFALPKDRGALKARLDAGIEESIRTGTANQLYLRWLGNLSPDPQSYRSGMMVGLWVVIPLLCIVGVLLLRWRTVRTIAATAVRSRQSAEQAATRLLHHDPVTAVANAAGLRAQLGRLLDGDRPFGLIRIDLLGLDLTEAITGHAFTDALLRDVAQRLLHESGRPVVASVGRGTFYVVCFDAVDEASGALAMEELVGLVSQPVETDGVPIELTCAAGAALYPRHGGEAGALMRAATVACAAATPVPGSGILYDSSFDPDPRNLTLLTDLRRAIADARLGFALQAKVDLRTNEVCGAEMLVRWTHPVYGPLAPCDFVPLAERTQIIGEMTLYLIGHAVEQCRQWSEHGLQAELAINVSANDLIDPRVVAGILDRVRHRAGCLVLEITETAVMRDAERTLAAIAALRAQGLRVSLDDFGTGNASLTYLRQLRPDEVKIDRSFIAAVLESPADQAIVRSTISLAHSLGAKVTAEGVEDAATLDWLRRAGADAAQGFGLARPESPEQFFARLRRSRSDAA